MTGVAVFILIIWVLLTTAGLIYKSVEGHFPRYLFWWFYSWWWPFRKDDAGTLLADAIRVYPEKYEVNGYLDISGKLNGVEFLFETAPTYPEGPSRLRVDGKYIPISSWAAHKGWRTAKMMQRTINRRQSAKANAENLQRQLDGTKLVARLLLESQGEGQ